MLKIENVNDQKIYYIKNKYLCECGVLNEKNVCNVLVKYKKGINNWIELYNNDSFKTKKEKKRMSYYIIKLNEFERLLND